SRNMEMDAWNLFNSYNFSSFNHIFSNGNLLFRVDTYGDLILMDAQGKPLLTLCHK
ncbi:hypothetical protein KI387_003904, partial [Taxus chinensis]